MKIKLNVDSTGYTQKPVDKYGIIKNRVSKVSSIQEINPEALIDIVKEGRTFTPAQIGGKKATDWINQQIIVADIDNAGEAAGDPLTPDEASSIMQFFGITPFFMYYTFSNREDHPKYRIVLVLDEVITEAAEAADLTRRFAELFNHKHKGTADTCITNGDRFIFGSTRESIIQEEKVITSVEVLRSLPEAEEKKTQTADINKSLVNISEVIKSYNSQDFTADEIQSFDLESYILRTAGGDLKTSGNTKYINPCPLCGHYDDFAIYGNVFVAYGAGDQQHRKPGRNFAGGTIIDYLMFKDNLTLSEAFNKFKYDIQGHERPQEKTSPAEYIPPEPPGDPVTPAELAEAAGAVKEPPRSETAAETIANFINDINSRKYEPYKTGISYFDKIIGGGLLKSTLVTLGAAPGAGKTAFCQFVLENIAKQGRKVLYINLEMDKSQLLARSISREAYMRARLDLSAADILKAYELGTAIRAKLTDIIRQYEKSIAQNITYNPFVASNDISDILETMEREASRMKAETGEAPIVCIDYLQLIANKEKRDGTEGLKDIIFQIKDFAKTWGTSIFLIIANNRTSNESGTASVTSGRDTSAIEYSGDIMLTLSYAAIEEKRTMTEEHQRDLNITKAKSYDLETLHRLKAVHLERFGTVPKVCNELLLKVVKNRFNGDGQRAKIFFDGRHSNFTE